jgi:hypothetical protein
MYTARRLTRPKIGNMLIAHHGTQVLRVDGRPAVYRLVVEGGLVTVHEPVIDFGTDGKVYVKTFQQFAAGRPITLGVAVDISTGEFDRRFGAILNDIRTYSLSERNCETTTDMLMEGAPANRQYKGAFGVALLFVGISLFAR